MSIGLPSACRDDPPNDPARLAREAAEATERRYADWDGIPLQLRAFDHFGLYTERKMAVSAKQLERGWPRHDKSITGDSFGVADPSSHSTFEHIRRLATGRGVSSLILGPTFALQAWMRLTVIDLDPPERAIEKRLQEMRRHNQPVPPDDEIARRLDTAHEVTRLIMKWAQSVGAWIEVSSSGKGTHIFVFGVPPHHYYTIGIFGNIYTQQQCIHLTGRMHPMSAAIIPNAQESLEEMIAYMMRERGIQAAEKAYAATNLSDIPAIETHGRRLDLSDEQVIATLPSINKSSYAMLTTGISPTSNWSGDMAALIGDLDKITGDPDQVLRIIEGSVCFAAAGTNHTGNDRQTRTTRHFVKELSKKRPSNDRLLADRAERREAIDALKESMAGVSFTPARPPSRAERRAWAAQAEELARKAGAIR